VELEKRLLSGVLRQTSVQRDEGEGLR